MQPGDPQFDMAAAQFTAPQLQLDVGMAAMSFVGIPAGIARPLLHLQNPDMLVP